MDDFFPKHAYTGLTFLLWCRFGSSTMPQDLSYWVLILKFLIFSETSYIF